MKGGADADDFDRSKLRYRLEWNTARVELDMRASTEDAGEHSDRDRVSQENI